MRRIAQLTFTALLVAVFMGAGFLARPVAARSSGKAPVQAGTTSFGKILVNSNGLTLYYWEKEKSGHIKCTRACAAAWPPLLVHKGAKVSHTLRGIKGTFDTVKRPDGRLQVTFNRRALYLYQGDKKPGDTLCQAVEGWYVIKSSGKLTGPSGS